VGYAFCGEVVEAAGMPASPAAGVNLCWLLKDGHRIPLRSGENILGRDVEGTIDLDSTSVSRRHARIVVSEHNATIEDLGSKNVSFVRGQRVTTTVALADGDDLRIGSISMHFRRQARCGSTMTLSSMKRVSTSGPLDAGVGQLLVRTLRWRCLTMRGGAKHRG